MLADFRVTSAEEVSLGANLRAGDRRRLRWKLKEENEVGSSEEDSWDHEWQRGQTLDLAAIILRPMQIRTFVVQIESR